MAGDVVIRITAVDGASAVLKKIGDSATKAARDLDKAGKDGGKSLDQIDQRAKKADQQMRTFERTSLAVGAALGATAFAVIKVSAAYQQQERQLAALNRLYGDAGQQMIAYAETIQNTTKFSNDAARDSAVVLNTLVGNYGLATGQIEQLISRSADLAQLHGKSLTEVSQMVSNALRGEAEYIEQIGVTLNQTFVAQQAAARGLGNFISDLTAAEQAAFRFTLLMEQTATAQGYATETATGMRGAIGLMINTFGDVAQSAGGALGPIRDLAAEFNNYALWLPLIGSQMGRFAAILKSSMSSGTAAAGAMSLLRFAMNPLALLVGGLVIGLGALGIKYLENKQAAAQAAAQAEATAASFKVLDDSITQMYISGDDRIAAWVEGQNTGIQTVLSDWNAYAESMKTAGLNDVQITSLEALGLDALDVSEYFTEAEAELVRARHDFAEKAMIQPEEQAAINASLGKLFDLANNPNINLEKFQSETTAFFEQLQIDLVSGAVLPTEINDEIDIFYDRMARTVGKVKDLMEDLELAFRLDDLRIDGLDQIADDVEAFVKLTDMAITATGKSLDAMKAKGSKPDDPLFSIADIELTLDQVSVVEASMKRLDEAVNSGDFDNPAITKAITDLYFAFEAGTIDAATYTEGIAEVAAGLDDFTKSALDAAAVGRAVREGAFAAADEMFGQAEAMQKEQAEQREEMIAAAVQAIEEFNEARASFLTSYYEAFQMDDPVSKINLSSLRNEFTGLAGDVAGAASQLETVFRVIVENTNAIAGQAQGVADWADGLFEVVDGSSKIGDLLANNFINQTQYNDALAAQGQIQESNNHIQRDVLTIQAMQAPLIAEQTAALEAQMHTVSNMPAEQQRITLGWMDAQTAGQAYTLMTQAAQVATGELGAVGEGAFKSMIEGAVAVNPLLFDMLETIGLVSGTPLDFKVNLDGVTEGMSEIERLTMSIDALIVQLGGMPPDIKLGVKVDGEEEISSVMAKINEWGGLDNTNLKVGVEVDNEGLANFQGIVDNLTNRDPIAVQAKIEISETNAGLASFQNIVNNLMDIEPVKVPAQLDLAGSIEDPEPIIVPVTYDVSAADLPTIEPMVVQVSFNIDASAITNAMAEWSMGGEVQGPIVKFLKEDGEVQMALGDWQAVGTVSGPIVRFDTDAAIPQASLDRWTGMGAVGGPIVTFESNSVAPAESLSHWTGMGAVGGPTVTFKADTSAVASALSTYSGTRVIGTRIIDVVTRSSPAASYNGIYSRHGGIPGMAHGGILIHAAENNQPEIATFANGGTARLSQEGNYMVPPHTLITPSNVHRGAGAGITVNIQTGDWYGGSRPDLDEWAADGLIPALAEEFGRDERASGRAA